MRHGILSFHGFGQEESKEVKVAGMCVELLHVKTFKLVVASKLYGVNAAIITFVFVLYCILFYCIVFNGGGGSL